MRRRTVSDETIFEQMPNVITWLEGLGVPATNSRYVRYSKHIDAFFATDDPQTEEGRTKFSGMTRAYRECLDIILIYKAFVNERHEKFLEKLKKVVSGQDVPAARDAGESRNYLFELLVAARFKSAGYFIDFGFLTDVVAKRQVHTVYGECKRISSERKMEANIRDAADQLSKQVSALNAGASGLIFVDVSSCVQPEISSSPVSPERIGETSVRALKSFTERNKEKIDKLNEEFKNLSLATCFVVQIPFWGEDHNLYTASTIDVSVTGTLSAEKYEQLKEILDGFEGAFNRYLFG